MAHQASPPLAAISATAPTTRDRSAYWKVTKDYTALDSTPYGWVINGTRKYDLPVID